MNLKVFGRRSRAAPQQYTETLQARLERECAQLSVLYRSKVEYGWDRDHGWWVCIEEWPLPNGTSHEATRLIILIPPEYPAAAPNVFYIPEGATVADGWSIPTLLPSTQDAAPEGWSRCAFPVLHWRDGDDLHRALGVLHTVLAVATRIKSEPAPEPARRSVGIQGSEPMSGTSVEDRDGEQHGN